MEETPTAVRKRLRERPTSAETPARGNNKKLKKAEQTRECSSPNCLTKNNGTIPLEMSVTRSPSKEMGSGPNRGGVPGAGGGGNSTETISWKEVQKYFDTKTDHYEKKITETVHEIGQRVRANSDTIRELQKTVEKLQSAQPANGDVEARIETRMKELLVERISTISDKTGIHTQPETAPIRQSGQNIQIEEQNRRKFQFSRRALRLWPVPGNGDAELRSELGKFLRSVLRVDEEEVGDKNVERIRRVKAPRKSHAFDEVLVIFDDKYSRDRVSAHAKNLSEYVESITGKPNAGLKIDYPDHLAAVFRLLETYGRELRNTHGPGLKRHIKFDDELETLYMDVKLPTLEEWLKITPQLAKENRKQMAGKEEDHTRKILHKASQDGNSNLTPLGVLPSRNNEGSNPERMQTTERQTEIPPTSARTHR